jgi:hypothetical protein
VIGLLVISWAWLFGIAAGFAIGFAAGKQQKPWSELTEQEKKFRKLLIGAGVAILVLGAMVFALFEFGLSFAR